MGDDGTPQPVVAVKQSAINEQALSINNYTTPLCSISDHFFNRYALSTKYLRKNWLFQFTSTGIEPPKNVNVFTKWLSNLPDCG